MTGARVPFALVGVVLVVGSTAFVGSLPAPVATGPAVDDAMDRASAEVNTAVREAVTVATTGAAREPVTRRVNTTFGATLNRTDTFRDALRIRIYVAAREHLRAISGERRGLDVRATLPPTRTPAALRSAKRRVTVERHPTLERAVRVEIRNLSLVATRNGRPVGRTSLSPEVTVPTPTLVVHDRVRAFERRLNAGPLRPGLGRRLTTRLTALAWVRGYAQFRGTPITNVIANRHVGLVTNGAVLSMQREQFGESDPRGRSLLGIAAANTGATDLIDGAGHPVTDALSSGHDLASVDRVPATVLSGAGPEVGSDDRISLAINGTADEAFLETASGLEESLQAYRTRVQRRVTVERRGETRLRETARPGPEWRLAATDSETTATVEHRETRERSVEGPWHPLARYSRSVSVTTTTTRTWALEDRTETTVERRRERFAVGISLVGRHNGGPAPTRPFRAIHEQGGPLEGPNLAGVRERARQRLLESRGGVDAVARRAPQRERERTVSTTVSGEKPERLERWIRADLMGLRERTRNVSITTTRGAVATLETNPARRLLDRLRDRRAALLDTPETYGGVADRARVETRQRYLRRVERRLESRARTYDTSRQAFGERLRDHGVGSLDALRPDDLPGSKRPTNASRGDRMWVRTAPAYLTLGKLHGQSVPAIEPGETEHPLVARNLNLASVPYGDVADAVVSGLLGPDRIRLGTGARVLRASDRLNRALEGGRVESSALRSEVSGATEYLRERTARTFERAGLGDPDGRREVVRTGVAEWSTVGARAMAFSNGSAARSITVAAVARWNLSSRRADLLGLRVERAIETGLTDRPARPRQSAVDGPVGALRSAAAAELTETLSDTLARSTVRGIDALTRRSVSTLPAGLPLVPAPGAWYATVNAWRIQVRGEYARFAVSVPRGTPDRPGASVRYVRDGSPVSLDVDGDGTAERLGRADRVSFRTGAAVAIAVPPGVRGVGDKGGDRDERSPGWPHAGNGRGK